MIIDQLFTQPIFEAADPNRLIVSVTIPPMSTGEDPEVKDFDLTGRFQGDARSQINQATAYLKKFFESKGINFTNFQATYQGQIVNQQNIGSMEPQNDAERELDSMANQIRAKRPAQNATPAVKEVAPPGAKAERMVKHIKAGYARDGKLTPKEKGIAFATAWKAHNAGRVEEATGDERFDSMMGQIQREPRIPDSQMPPTDVKDLYHWAVKHHKPYHKIFAKWANREGFKSVAPALQKAGNLDSDAIDYWTPEAWKLWHGGELPHGYSRQRIPEELRDYLETVFDAYDRIVFDWPTEYRQISEQGVAEHADPKRDKLERMIWKYFGQIYDYGDDDGLNYLDEQGDLFNQLMDKYNGEIDDIISHEPLAVLMQAAQELKHIAHEMTFDLDEAAQGHTIEAHGVRGMDRRTWHKTFRNTDQMTAWAEKHDAEIMGTRDLEQARHHNLSPAEQDVTEGVAETVSMDQAKKVLRHYGADHFKTTTNELHFYKNGRPFSVDLIFNYDDATRSVSLRQLNSATRRLKGQGVAEGLDEASVMELSNKTMKQYRKQAQTDIDTTDHAGLYTDSDIDRIGRRSRGIDRATLKIKANKEKEREQGVAEAFDSAAFDRHMDKLRAQKKLEKTDPMRALVNKMHSDDAHAAKMKRRDPSTDDDTNIHSPFHSSQSVNIGEQGVAEGLTEMDKSQTPPGRDTGPRSGPEKIAKPITKEKMVNHALDTLSKSMAKKDDKKKDVKESDTLMLKLKRAMVREGRVKELADDLKTMSDADFMKKYGKAKAAIRRDMNKHLAEDDTAGQQFVGTGTSSNWQMSVDIAARNARMKAAQSIAGPNGPQGVQLPAGTKYGPQDTKSDGTGKYVSTYVITLPAPSQSAEPAPAAPGAALDSSPATSTMKGSMSTGAPAATGAAAGNYMKVNELSTNKLSQYKTAAARDAKKADQAGDFKRGDKRLSGMVQATKKQFDNDAKKVDESRAARRALMARIVNSR